MLPHIKEKFVNMHFKEIAAASIRYSALLCGTSPCGILDLVAIAFIRVPLIVYDINKNPFCNVISIQSDATICIVYAHVDF